MTLQDWLATAHAIVNPASGYRHHRAIDRAARHGRSFPFAEVALELDCTTLEATRALLTSTGSHPFARPTRGWRANHWTTPALMAVNNQLARLRRIPGRNAA